MCTMALLHRALAASQQAAAAPADASAAGQAVASAASGTSGTSTSSSSRSSDSAGGGGSVAEGQQESEAAYRDHRMPRRLVAIAGVYDIGKHYEYEEGEPAASRFHGSVGGERMRTLGG
jgi:hypothetical protein